MDKKVFEAYSLYYDLLYKDKNYIEETNYIHSLILQFCPQTQHILELGCGTGIHALYLAEKGFKVEGVDISETMLNGALDRQSKAKLEVAARLSFLEADIRNYVSAIKFDAIISLFHVMSYMISNNDLNQVFQTVKKQLKPNGIFIFDCWHGLGVLNDKPISRSKYFDNEIVSIRRNSVPHFDPKKNRVDVSFDINIQNHLTNETIKLYEMHSMRYLFIDELKSIAEINGIEIIHAEEWLTKKSLSEKSWNACYVCRNKF